MTELIQRPGQLLDQRPGQLPGQLPGQRQQHLAHLDGMRGLAALFVLLHHAFVQVEMHTAVPPSWAAFTGWLFYGRFSVDAFIVLSGFCLTLPLADHKPFDIATFYRKRARRILPPFYFALALSLALGLTILTEKTSTLWDFSLPITVSGIMANIFMLQDVVHIHEINPAFWSLAVEAKIYLAFPLIVIGWKRMGPWWTASLSIATGVAISRRSAATAMQGLNAHYLGLFAAGMLACHLTRRNGKQFREFFLIALFCACGVIVVICRRWGIAKVTARECDVDLLVGFAVACLLVCTQPGTILFRCFAWQPLVFLGTFAYSVYLIHIPLLQLGSIFFVLPSDLAFGSALAVTFGFVPVILIMAYLFFLAFERPFLSSRLKRAVDAEQSIGIEPARSIEPFDLK